MEHPIEEIMAQVKYPFMRFELKNCIKNLSEKEFQIKNWVEHSDPNINTDLDFCISVLFDDLDLGDEDLKKNNLSAVGILFWDESEAIAVSDVIRAIQDVDKSLDKSRDFETKDVINSPVWPTVIEKAQIALTVLEQNDKLRSPRALINQINNMQEGSGHD